MLPASEAEEVVCFADILSGDGLHPSDLGHARIAERLQTTIEAALPGAERTEGDGATMTEGGDDWRQHNRASNEAWEVQAEIWDQRMGDDGNDFHQQLVRPAAERLLALQAGERVLDLGCGNGVFARRLGRAGATVVAVDVSVEMIRRARARTTAADGDVEYGVLDATSTADLAGLGTGFDAVVSNMVLMDIADLDPLAAALPRLLKPGGRFVFVVTHPCFNNGTGTGRMAEAYADESGMHRRHFVTVSRYITPVAETSRGICNRDLQYSFHRPLSVLLTPFFDHGFALDGLEEPVFPSAEGEGELGQGRFAEIPWALAARLRRQG